MPKFLVFLFLALVSPALLAQADSIPPKPQDTIMVAEIMATPVKVRKPGNALKWALIPGGGQIYNRSWWKVPIVYGALLGAVGYADFNTTNYRRFVDALEAECFGPDIAEDCEPQAHEFTDIITSTDALRNLRDNFDRQRQNAYLFILITYLLQGVEAYSDAHLRTFDMNEDLGMQIRPALLPNNAIGVGISIPIGIDRSALRQRASISR